MTQMNNVWLSNASNHAYTQIPNSKTDTSTTPHPTSKRPQAPTYPPTNLSNNSSLEIAISVHVMQMSAFLINSTH